jgi:hypothetical protein
MESFGEFLRSSVQRFDEARERVEQVYGTREVLGEERFLELVNASIRNLPPVGATKRRSDSVREENEESKRELGFISSKGNGVPSASKKLGRV